MKDEPDVLVEALELLKMYRLVNPEGEDFDVSDHEYTNEELVRLKAELGSIRTACDAVSRALARSWDKDSLVQTVEFPDGSTYYLGYPKQKKFIGDEEGWAEWVLAQPPGRIPKLFTPTQMKVSDLAPVERETWFDEQVDYEADGRIQQRKPR